jgi:hypothetical protein
MPVEVAVVAIFGSVGFYLAAILGIWIVSRARSQRAEIHAQVQQKLIERFQSAPELIEFLQSAPGQKFVTGIDAVPRMMTRERILGGVSKSIIFATVGIALLLLCINPDIRNEFLLFVGGLTVAIGVGYLIATFVSLKLGRSMGLINGVHAVTTTEPTTES